VTVLRRTLGGALAVAVWIIFPLFGVAHADTTAASQLALIHSSGCKYEPMTDDTAGTVQGWSGGSGCDTLPAPPSADVPPGSSYFALVSIDATSAGWQCDEPPPDGDDPTCNGTLFQQFTGATYTASTASWLVPDVPSAGDYGADAVAPAVLAWISSHGAPFVAGLLFVGIAFALLIRNARRGARAA
jgi:hypothetical protein